MYCIILKNHLCAQRVWNFFTIKNCLLGVMQLSLLLATQGTTRRIQSLATSPQLIGDFSDRLSLERIRTRKTRMKPLRSRTTGNVSRGSLVLMTNLTWMGLSRRALLSKGMISLLGRQLQSDMFRTFMKTAQNFAMTLEFQLLQAFLNLEKTAQRKSNIPRWEWLTL